MGRDDLVISARSIFLNKGNRQKFSLLTLIIASIIILSLEYFKTGPINQFRIFAKDVIFKTSYFISLPFSTVKNTYHDFNDYLKIYEENKKLKNRNLNIQELKFENQFLKEENIRLNELIEEKSLFLKLCKSKVFLSFSHLEGFGMPPLEAAIAGNKVIGYTGEGGKEYWKKPIFEEIESGNIKKFSESVINTVNNFPKNWNTKTSFQRTKLMNTYSINNQKKLVIRLIHKIKSFY